MTEDELAVLSVPTPHGKSPLQVPASNDHFVYAVGRAMSFWPIVNGNNATWLEEEIAKLYADTVDTNLTFKGKLVNIDHEIGPDSKRQVIGTTIDEKYIPGVGVDVLNQLDRRQLESYEIKAEEFAGNGEYSKQSVEINCDRSKSKFIVITNPGSPRLEDQRIFSAEEAASLGVRRTIINDPQGPYYFDGKYKVVEAGIPNRVRGIAMLNNPADITSEVYDIAASKIADDDLSALQDVYADTQPMSLSNDDQFELDDSAYAVVQGNVEAASVASIKVRELPLYQTNEHKANGTPHGGLIKAAVDALGADKGTRERRYSPSVHAEALKRVHKAHEQLTGEKSMAITPEERAALVDPLQRDIDELKAKRQAAVDENAALADRVNIKDTEIAGLKTQITDKDAEIANLTQKIADLGAADLAAARISELGKIDGFVIKDEEKAALVESLKSETEDQFKNRILREENASLLRKIAAGVKSTASTDEAAKKLQAEADEHAGLKTLTSLSGDEVKVSKTAYDFLL